MFCTFLHMPTNAGKSGSTLAGEFWGGRLDGVAGMPITMLLAAVGAHRTLLQPLLGVGIRPRFPIRRIREPRRVLHCSHHFASQQTMSVKGAVLDEFVQGSLLCWKRTCERNHVKDSTLRIHFRAALAAASRQLHREAWLALYELAEEKGEHVRLDWRGVEPPCSVHDGRAAGALLALQLTWATVFSYVFFQGKHINLMELEPDQPPQAGYT